MKFQFEDSNVSQLQPFFNYPKTKYSSKENHVCMRTTASLSSVSQLMHRQQLQPIEAEDTLSHLNKQAPASTNRRRGYIDMQRMPH